MRAGHLKRLWPSYAVLVVSLGLWLVAYYYVDQTVSADEAHRFDVAVRTLKQHLEAKADRYTDLLLFSRAHLDASPGVTRESWRRFVEGANLPQHPGLQGLGFARRVTNDGLAMHVAKTREEGFPAYRVRPAGDRPLYFPVWLIEPFDARNQRAFGFDMFSDPVRREAMEAAAKSGEPRVSARVTLMQEDGQDEQAGFLMYVPVYRQGTSPNTPQERWAALEGFVYAPFRAANLMRGITGELGGAGAVDYQLYDSERATPDALLYDSRAPTPASGPATAQAPLNPATVDLPDSSELPYRSQLRVAGRTWTLVAAPSPTLLQTVDHHLPWLVLTGGALVSWLLFGITWLQMRARAASERASAQLAASESRLRASELRYRLKIEQSPVAAQTLSPDGLTVHVNRAWEQLWGIGLADVKDYNILQDPELERKGVMPLIRAAFAGQTVTIGPIYYESMDLPSGAHPRARWVRSVLYPVKDPTTGVVTELVLLHEDFTLRKEAEAELQRAKETAEAANHAKDQFLAVLSHELRNPLSPVLAMVDLLAQGNVSGEGAAEAVEVIRRNVELEARLIDDLLDVTRIARGKLHLDRSPVDAHVTLEHALQICRPDAAAKGLAIEVSLEARDRVVSADPARLQQIFWNLIKNAVKFTPEGGRIFISTRNETARSAAEDRAADGMLVMEVRDTGIGVAPDKLPRIFDAFEQADGSITRRFGGLGLGLTITRALVSAHGGMIGVSSDGAGRGTTFTVRLPVEREEAAPAQPTPAEVPRVSPAAGTEKFCVLLIEDQTDARRALALLLSREGFEVRAAGTAAEALEKAQGFAFDLIISDIGLPDLSGLELLPRLRALRPAPAIALTGFGMEQDVQRAAESGFDVHITKPVSFERLRAAMDRLLQRRA
jgi:PAS domain S-box-containing protein